MSRLLSRSVVARATMSNDSSISSLSFSAPPAIDTGLMPIIALAHRALPVGREPIAHDVDLRVDLFRMRHAVQVERPVIVTRNEPAPGAAPRDLGAGKRDLAGSLSTSSTSLRIDALDLAPVRSLTSSATASEAALIAQLHRRGAGCDRRARSPARRSRGPTMVGTVAERRQHAGRMDLQREPAEDRVDLVAHALHRPQLHVALDIGQRALRPAR